MTPFLIRIAVLFLFILLFRWFFKQLFVSRKNGTGGRTSAPRGNMVRDPVCGMYMDQRLAVAYEKKNGVFYFCSEECKNRFLEMTPVKNPGEPPQAP